MKLYWILEKDTLHGAVCGSITSVSKVTGININSLYYYFSVKKVEKYDSSRWLVNKVELIRTKKK